MSNIKNESFKDIIQNDIDYSILKDDEYQKFNGT
jgi:hypothetical protein